MIQTVALSHEPSRIEFRGAYPTGSATISACGTCRDVGGQLMALEQPDLIWDDILTSTGRMITRNPMRLGADPEIDPTLTEPNSSMSSNEVLPKVLFSWRSSGHVKTDDGASLPAARHYFTVMEPIMYWWMLHM